MAPKDGWSRLREREEEEEREREEELQSEILKRRLQGNHRPDAGADIAREASMFQSSGASDKLVELLDRVEPLLEQVNVLYAQFFSGMERLPPKERHKQLDQVMTSLTAMSKPTQILQFRFNTLRARYRTYCEQWAKKLKDVESGKIARPLMRGR